MKRGKIIAIVIAIVIVILIAVGATLIINDIKQKELIIQELNQIEEIINLENMDKEALEGKVNNVVATGDYAVVEKALKTYLSDVFTDATKLSELLSDEKLSDILTVNNYKNDGPDFVTTKEYLTNTKNKIDDTKDIVYAYFTEKKIMSYINNQDVNTYYVNLYKKLVLEDVEKININEDIEKIDESINLIYNIMDVENETIDFLIKNKGKWEVLGENIVFDSNELVVQYTNIINKLKE